MAGAPEKIAGGFHFTECPRWRDGALYFVDMHGDRIYRAESGVQPEVFLEIENPAGLGWMPNGDMLIVSSRRRELLRYSGGKLSLVVKVDNLGYQLLNDMVVDRRGGAYIGGVGLGMDEGIFPPVPVIYVSPGGQVSIAADNLYNPNGMAIAPDGRALIVAETMGHRLTAFDIQNDGSLSGRRVWADFGSARPSTTIQEVMANNLVLPDGIALDADGAVWVADARGGGVIRVAEGGRELDRITFGANTVIAPALGGPDGNVLYMMVGPAFAELGAALQGGQRLYGVYRAQVDAPAA